MKHLPPVKAKKPRSPDRGSSLLEECPMNDIVVQALCEYLEESEEPDTLWWPEHWFVEVSTSRWIAGELINAILDHPMTPAEDTIEELAIKMTAYHADSDGTKAERIFSIAEKCLWEWLELFREENIFS